jgi:16S rRNA processing protein RimM
MLSGLEPAELPADAIEVGRIADAWGIKGWFKVLPHSASAEALFSSRRWYLQPAERGARVFTGTQQLSIKEVKIHADSVVATAQEVPDRSAAETLKGARVLISRADFPAAAPDEYYWVDLIGLQVINREGVSLGEVRELLSTGPQTVLVLEYPRTDGDRPGMVGERMIPFVSAYVDSVDMPSRRILVDWQPDY